MSILKHYTGNATAVQTTDAITQTTIHTFTPGSHPTVLNNCVLQVIGTLIGKGNVDGTQGVTLEASATFTISSGTVALAGTQTTIIAAQGSAFLTSVLTLDASSNVIRLRVNGVVANTINWTGWLEIKSTEI